MADGNDRTQHTLPSTAAKELLLDGLLPCTLTVTPDGTWYVMAQLAADEQAALRAALPCPDTLCQRAQHALGLAGIGSRIEPGHNAIGVYATSLPSPDGEFLLVLEGRAVLWSVSRASSEVIRALIAAATEAMRQSPIS